MTERRSRPRRYLVTGGCGFIGAHLVRSLIADGHDVVVLDDLSTGRRANLPPQATLIVGSASDPATVARAAENTDGCFHLAAVASVARSIDAWVETHRANQTGTICVLDAARRPDGGIGIPVVYASSAAVYGDSAAGAIAEKAPTRPLTAYGADKVGSELHASVAWQTHRVPTVGLRLFNAYGPQQDPSSPYAGVIAIFADSLTDGRTLTIHGDGGQVRDFIHVADAVAGLRAAMQRCTAGAAVYNICTGRPTTIGELARLMAELLGRVPDIRYAPRRAGDIRHSLGSPDRAARELQFRAQVSLRDGLSALLRKA